jgi:hypothetical protein
MSIHANVWKLAHYLRFLPYCGTHIILVHTFIFLYTMNINHRRYTMQESDLKKVFSRKKKMVSYKNKDFGLLFDMETGRIHKIGLQAYETWELLDGKTSVGEIITLLKKEYNDIEDEKVITFLKTLKTMGCTKVVPPDDRK